MRWNCFIRYCTVGMKNNAPDPKPAIVRPDAMPFYSAGGRRRNNTRNVSTCTAGDDDVTY
jgi:hypothetical protein